MEILLHDMQNSAVKNARDNPVAPDWEGRAKALAFRTFYLWGENKMAQELIRAAEDGIDGLQYEIEESEATISSLIRTVEGTEKELTEARVACKGMASRNTRLALDLSHSEKELKKELKQQREEKKILKEEIVRYKRRLGSAPYWKDDGREMHVLRQTIATLEVELELLKAKGVRDPTKRDLEKGSKKEDGPTEVNEINVMRKDGSQEDVLTSLTSEVHASVVNTVKQVAYKRSHDSLVTIQRENEDLLIQLLHAKDDAKAKTTALRSLETERDSLSDNLEKARKLLADVSEYELCENAGRSLLTNPNQTESNNCDNVAVPGSPPPYMSPKTTQAVPVSLTNIDIVSSERDASAGGRC